MNSRYSTRDGAFDKTTGRRRYYLVKDGYAFGMADTRKLCRVMAEEDAQAEGKGPLTDEQIRGMEEDTPE